ncbi:MAG: hypothetical protein JXR59_00410 [Desulfuromonadaceae bacterium]|nr:hypothetical protein [Desulfuromonadaceae bacterium]
MMNQKIKYFLFGIVASLTVLLLLGNTSSPPPNYGRYQISAWGAPSEQGASFGAFVLDSVTGETKLVYCNQWKAAGSDARYYINQLDKPFHAVEQNPSRLSK